jgi:diacylglycerol kinase family enzyme/membrane-associated phospholipid phosphatase
VTVRTRRGGVAGASAGGGRARAAGARRGGVGGPHGTVVARHGVVGRWGGLQRRVRRLVPRPIRRADLAAFRAVARTDLPVVGPLLPRLSTAANHSRLWIVVAALLGLAGGRFGRRAGLRGFVAIGVTSAVTNLPAKLLTGRTRPDLDVVPEIRRLARVPTSTSFPSGHSASAFAFATAAGLELPALRAPLLGLAGAVAFSRVYTGVHYPGDALVGSAIGVALARATTRSWPLAERTPATGTVVTDEPLAGPDGEGLVVVANAGAGNALAPGPASTLRRALPAARIAEHEPGEDLQAALRRAAAEAVVLGVAGGDGSASAAAAVAHELGRPLAVVPGGTLNHLAGDLGLDEVDATVRAVREGRAVAMDLAEIDGRPFVNAASIGAYPHLVLERERLESRIGKWPAVAWSLLKILATHHPAEVDLDGRRRRVWFVFIGNGCFAPQGIAPSRRSRLDDGLLDVRVVSAEVPWARTRVVASMLTGRLGRCRAFERWLCHDLEVRSYDGPLQLARDGEVWEGGEAFTIRKRPGALVVLQPAS